MNWKSSTPWKNTERERESIKRRIIMLPLCTHGEQNGAGDNSSEDRGSNLQKPLKMNANEHLEIVQWKKF
jgi:hypothetical protein